MKCYKDRKDNMYTAKFWFNGQKYTVKDGTKRDLQLAIRQIMQGKSINAPGKQTEADGIKGMVEIYDQALETHGTKGPNSIYPKQEFVHQWTRKGTKIYGLPKGTLVILPDGDEYNLDTRSILMVNQQGSHLWDLFLQ